MKSLNFYILYIFLLSINSTKNYFNVQIKPFLKKILIMRRRSGAIHSETEAQFIEAYFS
jgi:hypothetical protein